MQTSSIGIMDELKARIVAKIYIQVSWATFSLGIKIAHSTPRCHILVTSIDYLMEKVYME